MRHEMGNEWIMFVSLLTFPLSIPIWNWTFLFLFFPPREHLGFFGLLFATCQRGHKCMLWILRLSLSDRVRKSTWPKQTFGDVSGECISDI